MALQCAKTRFETADGEVSSARAFSLVCSKRANAQTAVPVLLSRRLQDRASTHRVSDDLRRSSLPAQRQHLELA